MNAQRTSMRYGQTCDRAVCASGWTRRHGPDGRDLALESAIQSTRYPTHEWRIPSGAQEIEYVELQANDKRSAAGNREIPRRSRGCVAATARIGQVVST